MSSHVFYYILIGVHIIPMLVPCNSNCPSTIAHYHSPIKFNPKSINPLIGNNYTVYPTLKLSKFSFNNVLNHDFRLYNSLNDKCHLVQDLELNEDCTDYSKLI